MKQIFKFKGRAILTIVIALVMAFAISIGASWNSSGFGGRGDFSRSGGNPGTSQSDSQDSTDSSDSSSDTASVQSMVLQVSDTDTDSDTEADSDTDTDADSDNQGDTADFQNGSAGDMQSKGGGAGTSNVKLIICIASAVLGTVLLILVSVLNAKKRAKLIKDGNSKDNSEAFSQPDGNINTAFDENTVPSADINNGENSYNTYNINESIINQNSAEIQQAEISQSVDEQLKKLKKSVVKEIMVLAVIGAVIGAVAGGFASSPIQSALMSNTRGGSTQMQMPDSSDSSDSTDSGDVSDSEQSTPPEMADGESSDDSSVEFGDSDFEGKGGGRGRDMPDDFDSDNMPSDIQDSDSENGEAPSGINDSSNSVVNTLIYIIVGLLTTLVGAGIASACAVAAIGSAKGKDESEADEQ